MFRLLPFLVFVLLAGNAYAQGVDIEDVLKSIDPGGRRTVEATF